MTPRLLYQDYALSLTTYFSERSHTEHEKSDIYQSLGTSDFSAQLSDTKSFGRIPVDQILEETVKRLSQTGRGTKRFSLKPGFVSRYYITAENESTYFSGLKKDTFGFQQNAFSHKGLGQCRILKDEQQIFSIVDLFKSN